MLNQMTHVSNQPLNAGQQAAADGFFQFLLSDEKELSISGPGGVGKTFLMGYLIDTIIPDYQNACQILGVPEKYTSVVMTATTNKAAEVLAESTNRPCETIHKYLNLTVKDNYKTGESTLQRTSAWVMRYDTIVFVDEGSMIDTPLLKELRESTHNCKIVFVGDHCQMSPVKEAVSPIYKKAMPFFELTEPMRNSGQPALMNICTQLRSTVETGEFYPIELVPGVIDRLYGVDMETAIEHYFEKQNTNCRFLAYTNEKVESYNNYIRQLRQLPDEHTVGEILVNNSAVRCKDTMISVEEELEIIDISEPTEEEIDSETTLPVRMYTMKSKYATYFNVPVPIDKSYYQDLVKYYKSHKMWHPFFKLKNTYPDLRPRDAATIHKAQGSSYDVVFIDLDSLSQKCHRPDQAARLLYVAFSRARTRVILFGELADKYGGILE